MIKKKLSFFSLHRRLIFAGGVTAIFLCTTALAFYIAGKENVSQNSHSPDLPTQVLIGTVIRKNLDGLDYITDHTKEIAIGPSYGIAHSGDFISVDGEYFSPPNIRSIGLGDEVIVTYAIDESGKKTLHCRSCSIVKRLEYK